jgi:hypothetical protein
MPGKYIERSLIDFQKYLSDNECCAQHFVEQRWPDGFICPR